MKALYGICSHNIHQVLGLVRPICEKKGTNIQILDGLDKVKGNLIMVPSVSMFLRRRKELNKSEGIVFVFDAAVQCEKLTPIKVLDLHEKKKTFVYQFKPLDKSILASALKEADIGEAVRVKEQTVDVIPKLLNNEVPSLLTPILSFLYSVPNTDDRAAYSKVIYNSLLENVPGKKVKKKLVKLGAVEKQAARMANFLDTNESIVKLRKAIAIIQEKRAVAAEKKKKSAGISYKKIAAKHGLTEYDLKYFLSTLKKHSREDAPNVTTQQIHEVNIKRRTRR